MRIVEEGYLKRTVAKLNSYAAEQDTYESLFNGIDRFEAEPLQDLSFQSDLAYFDEMQFVLSVISSIISHPHISTKTENVILRTEFANTVSVENFQETLRDPALWKKDGTHMVPEYVHYHQSIDDLCIYENIFVVMLTKLLASEIEKYEEFYASLIQTFRGQEQLSLDEHNVSVALSRIRRLHKRIRYIQNTRFYKEVNRRYTPLRTVHPTNILLKDRLYNYCFKFYRSLVTYPDKASLLHDFSIHYYMLLLKSLRRAGFSLTEAPRKLELGENGYLLPPPTSFENDLYRLCFERYEESRGIVLTVEHKFVTNDCARRARHLLLFSPQSSFADLGDMAAEAEAYTTVEGISLWNMAYVEQEILPVYRNPLSEQEVMDEWLTCKISSSRASGALYRTFCPSCQSPNVNADEQEIRRCAHCGSQFTFFKDGEDRENLWFLKLRRSAYGKR
ncbi:MAG: hypothetical protein IJW30_05840 [Clostridia bacterium]|nr:hypothetical protein [Clostridia bacterium]